MPTDPQTVSDALDGWARRLSEVLTRSASTRTNETKLREHAHAVVVAAAAELYGLDDLATTGERRAGTSRRTYDRAYGGLIVEWEWAMDAPRRRHGAKQALDYLQELRADLGVEEVFSAVVCDGREWGFLVKDPPQGQLSLDDGPDPPAEQRFQWQPNSRASCRRFLALIGSNRQRPVSGPALVATFGQGSDVATKTITLLVEALAARERQDRPDTLFREWYRSLDVVYDSLDDPGVAKLRDLGWKSGRVWAPKNLLKQPNDQFDGWECFTGDNGNIGVAAEIEWSWNRVYFDFLKFWRGTQGGQISLGIEVLRGPSAFQYAVEHQYRLYSELIPEVPIVFCALDAEELIDADYEGSPRKYAPFPMPASSPSDRPAGGA